MSLRVLCLISFIIAVQCAEHRRPGLPDDQETTLVAAADFASLVTMLGSIPGNGRVADPGIVGVAQGVARS